MSYTPQRRKEDRGFRRLGVFFIRFFVVMGVSATISTVLLVVTLSRVVNYTPPSLPDKILLSWTFKEGLGEVAGKPSLSQPLLRPATTLHEITDALRNAAKDDRVMGFVAKIESSGLSVAQIQEVRTAVKIFRDAGKFAWIYSNSFGSYTPGMGDYYLASSFDRIWMQPIGAVAINGIAAEMPFFKGVFDKAGLEAEFVHKGTYKAGAESLTRKNMSKPHREMMTALIADLAAQIEEGIADSRGMTAAVVRDKVNRAPFTDIEARAEKLIDDIGYYDEMLTQARSKAGLEEEDKLVRLTGYGFFADSALEHGMVGFATNLTRRTSPPGIYKNKAKLALIYGSGDIVPYKSTTHAGFGGGNMAAGKVVEAFEDAMNDEDVAAIIFRVDSPGGSPEASETIRRAVIAAQKKGKPVVVSMSSYAASGGYWISAPADRIVAQPATLTGSIGVYGGKINAVKLWKKIGLGWDGVAEGEHARMWSTNKSFSKVERQRFDKMLGNIYDAFITRVAEGRGMTPEAVDAVAQGRVWTGRQAKEKGLVDALGGLDIAIALAKEEAKLDPEQYVPVLRFPPQKTGLENFMSLAVNGVSASAWDDIRIGDITRVVDSYVQRQNAALRMPDFVIK